MTPRLERSPARWRKWLQDPSVTRWHGTLAVNSEATADERLKLLSRYCEIQSVTPLKLVRRVKDRTGNARALHAQLQDFVFRLRKPHKPSDHLEDDNDPLARKRCERGHAPGYLAQYTKAVRSWLDYNDIQLRRVAIGDTDSAPTVENETILTPEELRDVLAAGSLRGRVVISLVALAGLRPEVLGTRRAQDGLTVRDLPDIEVGGRRILVKKTPARVMVRRKLSKVKRQYFSFLPGQATRYVVEYLEQRLARGEVLTPESPLIRPDYSRERRGRPAELQGREFLTTQAISSEIRDALRARGLPQRPYSLRAYFISRFESAERDGKITQLDRMFFSGRKDAVDLRYSHFKNLSSDVVEELRTVYARCVKHLGLTTTEDEHAEVKVSMKDVVDSIRRDLAVNPPPAWAGQEEYRAAYAEMMKLRDELRAELDQLRRLHS